MPILPLQIIPAPALRETALALETIGDEAFRLMDDMLATMYEHQGIGLAANQVGILKRVIVVDLSETRDGTEAMMMANPEILWASKDETFTYKEGCLSIPGQYADVTRPGKIRYSYINRQGKKVEDEASELLSQCIQHEIDHLNGVLFIDYLSALKRKMIIRKVEKNQKLAEEDRPL